MKKIAILGSENSHAWLFASVLAPLNGEKKYEDIELIGVYGENDDPEVLVGNESIKKSSSCDNFVFDKDAFLDDADAVMVTARDGAKHLHYAENYIKKGIPVWIDKPITRCTDEVLELVKLAKEYNCPISGGSSLEFDVNIKEFAELVKGSESVLGGHITAPVNMDNPYGGFWFYSQHLVAMVTTVFGYDIKSVSAVKTANGVNAIYNYDNFSVSAFYGSGYSVTVYTGGFSAVSRAFELPQDFFMPELDNFINVIKTGVSDKSTKEFIAPVFILGATIEAYETEKEIEIIIPKS